MNPSPSAKRVLAHDRVQGQSPRPFLNRVKDVTMLDLPDLSPDAPAGENLENDGAFGALERASRGKPEQQHGDLIIPAEDPDWKDVDAQATALLEKTRDLRILQYLALARLNLRGLTGFAEVLRAVRTQLEANWAYVHPQLDPEDDNDPTLRANALLGLSDSGRVLRVLRDLPLAISTRAGKISWRDIGVATGAIEAPDDRDRLTETTIRGAFQDADQVRLAALREALVSAIEDSVAVPAAFESNAGYGTGPDFADLTKLLRELSRYVERYGGTPEDADAEAGGEAEEAEAEGGGGEPRGRAAGGGRGVSAASLGPVTSRADAVRLLELATEYFQHYEPSSPLPLLIDRARRLADKSFLDILRDMAPDALESALRVVGNQEE